MAYFVRHEILRLVNKEITKTLSMIKHKTSATTAGSGRTSGSPLLNLENKFEIETLILLTGLRQADVIRNAPRPGYLQSRSV